ncbi:MAG: hypothetical protein GX259_03430 [Bacteroidales bacterium]|nr:hypothetical protein [Bacteroidales bacterium]
MRPKKLNKNKKYLSELNKKELKENPFITPKKYFPKLTSNILKAVGITSLLTLLRAKSVYIAVCSLAATLIGITIFYIHNHNNEIKNNQDNNSTKIIFTTGNNMNYDSTKNMLTIGNDISKSEILSYINNYNKIEKIDIENLEIINKENDEIAEENPITKQAEKTTKTVKHTKNSNLSAFDKIPNEICSETPIILDAYFPNCNEYSWNTGEKTSRINISKSGTYIITITPKNSKPQSKSISVKIIPVPTLPSTHILTGCYGSSVNLSVKQASPNYKYYWKDIETNSPHVTISKSGTYQVKIEGCKMYSDSFKVFFTDCQDNIPSIITPTKNNEFFIVENLHLFPNTSLQIFDTNKKQIFNSSNYRNNWKIKNTEIDKFLYTIKLKDGRVFEGSFDISK